MNQWISVKERLPQLTRPTFCYDDNGIMHIAYLSNGRWLVDHIDPMKRYGVNVTHWLECEPPPKPDPFDAWLAANVSDCSVRAFTRELLRQVWDAALASTR